MVQLPFIEQYLLRPNEVDVSNLLRLGSLANILQTAAWRSADELGFGYNDLYHMNLGWVLSRLHIRITDYPRMGELVFVHTWPKRTDRLFALRDFEIFSEEDPDTPVISASSAWLLIDIKSKRPRRPETLEHKLYTFDKDAIQETPSKLDFGNNRINEDFVDFSNTYQMKVERSKLDVNYHTNNAAYIDWIEDALPMEFFQKHHIHEFLINFNGETFVNDHLNMNYRLTEDLYEGYVKTSTDKQVLSFQAGFEHK
ncbi:acyl-[acyl-carrier-protein] thioesterase [Spirochaeta dissipatitropha]